MEIMSSIEYVISTFTILCFSYTQIWR